MSRVVTKTKTARLVPSANTVSSSSYLTVNNAENMYTNVDSDTYSQINHISTTNGAVGYLTVRGFNFSEVPSDANVTSFTIKYKAIQSGLSAATGTRARLLSGTSTSSTIAGSAATYVTSTATQTINFTGVSATWATIKGYGANFGIRHTMRRRNRNTSGYTRIYGHEITVNYDASVTEYELAVTNNSLANVFGDDYVESGGTGVVYFTGIQNASEISVFDNNVDVTSSLQSVTIPNDTVSVGTVAGASYGFTLDGQYYKSQNAGVNYSAALCRVNVTSQSGCTLRFYVVNYAEATYDYGVIGTVDTALGTTSAVTSDRFTWMGSASTSNSNSEQTVNVTIPAGTHYVDVKFRKDDATNSNNDALLFRYEIVNGSSTNGFSYTLSNVLADHTITVDDSGPATFYNVNATSSYSGATVTPSTQSIREGRNATVDIAVDNLYEIKVKDNGTDVTSSLVPVQGGTGSTNFTPSEFVTSASSYSSVYNNNNPSNGVSSDHTSTSRACVYSNTGSGVESRLTYRFDCSSIPENAIITSVMCSAKTSVYQTSYFTTRTVQLYNGDTAKGSPTTITSTGSDGENHVISGGSWTRQELEDIRIVELVTRSTSNPTSDASFSFWGATLRIEYSLPSGDYQYSLSNVTTSHTITIEEAPYYGVTFQNSYAGASFSVSPTKIYNGQNATVTLTVDDIDAIHIFDNGVNVDSSFVETGNSVYTYALTNVTTAHTISAVEATRYTVNASSNYTGVTITPATASVIDGKNVTFTLEPADDSIIVDQDVILLDNNVDVTSQLVTVPGETGTTTGVLGTFDPDMSSYVGIYNNYNYTNAEGNTVAQGMASTTSTRSSFYTATGAGATIMIVYNLDASSIVIPDGASIVNVSCQSVNSIAYSGQGFTEITSQLYSGTQPKGTATVIKESSATTMQDASAHTYTTDGGSAWTMSDLAQAKIALFGTRNNTNSNNDNTGIRDNVNFHGADLIVTYAMPGGCLYTISNVQGTHTLVVNERPSVTYNITCQSLYAGATVSPSSAQVKQGRSLTIHIDAANLYELAVKDNGVDVTASLNGSSGDYTYTITNIAEAHSIVIEEAVKYAISASSTYANATISPASMNVYKGQSGEFEIETPSLNLITLEDNGYDVTNNIVFVSGETFEVTGGTLGTFDATNSDYVGIYNNYNYTNAEGHTAAEGMASSSSTRSSFYPATGSGETVTVVYDIDVSQISLPADTVIVGVTSNVVLSIAFSGQGYSYVTAQLYSGLEPMGEPTVVKETTNLANAYAHEYEVHGGPGWTLNDLSQAKIRVYGVRNDTNSSADTSGKRDNVNIHGADLIVHYNYITAKTEYTYTVENVTTGHTLVLRQVQQCAVSTTSHLPNVTISSSTQSAIERDDVAITISGDLEGVILMDNGVDVTTALVFDGESAATYTIRNIHGDHTVVATAPSLEADYIKTGGEFKRVKGYWKKVNGTWTLISRESFGESVSEGLVFYGGLIEYQEVGEITKSGNTVSLIIGDNALPTGDTYTLKYEDSSRNPIDGIDKITDFTL